MRLLLALSAAAALALPAAAEASYKSCGTKFVHAASGSLYGRFHVHGMTCALAFKVVRAYSGPTAKPSGFRMGSGLDVVLELKGHKGRQVFYCSEMPGT